MGEIIKTIFMNYGLLGIFWYLICKILLLLIFLFSGQKILQWMKNIHEKVTKYWKNDDKKLRRQEYEEKEKKANENNLEIFQCFKKKWLDALKEIEQRETEGNLSESELFLQWLEINYEGHLYKHKINKKGHFENSRRWEWYESLLHGTNRIVVVVVESLILISSSAVGIQIVWDLIKKIGSENCSRPDIVNKSISLLFVIAIIIVAFGLKILISSEYIKRIDNLEQKRETWLRHEKAIHEYQYEMINYVMDSREYREVPQRDKEKICVDRIMDVWKRNQEQFQKNMLRHVEKDEEPSNHEST